MDQTVKYMFTCVAQVERHGPNSEVYVYMCSSSGETWTKL